MLTVVPFVELVILLRLAEWLGWDGTIVLVVFTGMLGAWLARREGLKAITKIQADLTAGVARRGLTQADGLGHREARRPQAHGQRVIVAVELGTRGTQPACRRRGAQETGPAAVVFEAVDEVERLQRPQQRLEAAFVAGHGGRQFGDGAGVLGDSGEQVEAQSGEDGQGGERISQAVEPVPVAIRGPRHGPGVA